MREPDLILDLRGVPEPISLLKASRVFGEMNADCILEIRGDDPDTRTDLFRVLPVAFLETVGFETIGDGYRLQIRKTE